MKDMLPLVAKSREVIPVVGFLISSHRYVTHPEEVRGGSPRWVSLGTKMVWRAE